MAELRAVSLFSNCGAGDVGYRDAGFHFDVMAELDPRRLQVALSNHPGAVGVPGDLRETYVDVIAKWREKNSEPPGLLAACPPCQGMSTARGGRGSENDHVAGGRDARNLLVTVIAQVAKELKPRSIVIENVPAFLRRAVPHPAGGAPISAALLLIELLGNEYSYFPLAADLAHWGVPQTRKRVFLTLIRNDEPGLSDLLNGRRTPYPRPTHAPDYGGRPVTLSEALQEMRLPSLDAQSTEFSRDASDPMHRVPVLSPRQYAMVAAIPPGSGLGAWTNNNCPQCGLVDDLDAEAAACPHCGDGLLRPVTNKEGEWRLIKGFRASSYSRMRPHEPASTITTASGHTGSDRTIHPFENRMLSLRECANLQTLPTDFEWGDAIHQFGAGNVREMIGEAVPPAFTHRHGLAIMGVLTGHPRLPHLVCDDERVERAESALAKARLAFGV